MTPRKNHGHSGAGRNRWWFWIPACVGVTNDEIFGLRKLQTSPSALFRHLEAS